MAIIQFSSTNPEFSYVIAKNPASGMSIKSIRKGQAFAWFSNENTYNVFFKDADNDLSYKEQVDESFEYLNTTRYCSTLFPLNAMNSFFSSATKNLHEKDTIGFENEVFINAIHVSNPRYLVYFQHHLPDFELTYTEIANKTVEIRVKTKRTLHELLHYTTVLCVFLSIVSNEYIDFTNDVIQKYITSMNVIDVPYYIRYLFARNVLNGRKQFNAFKEQLENTNHYNINFKYGNTAVQRQEWITDVLPFDKPIVDIGCGEGAYAIPYSKKLEDKMVYAIDIDPEVRDRLNHKRFLRNIENIAIYESLSHFLEFYEKDEVVNVLLTEVIEHMSEKQAAKLVKQILNNISFNTLVVTTPNAEFNSYYELEGFRHDDHKWEMTKNEYITWIESVLAGTKFTYEYYGVGDTVNEIPVSQAVIITNQ